MAKVTLFSVQGSLFYKDTEEIVDFELGPTQDKEALDQLLEKFEDQKGVEIVQYRPKEIEKGQVEHNEHFFDQVDNPQNQ